MRLNRAQFREQLTSKCVCCNNYLPSLKQTHIGFQLMVFCIHALNLLNFHKRIELDTTFDCRLNQTARIFKGIVGAVIWNKSTYELGVDAELFSNFFSRPNVDALAMLGSQSDFITNCLFFLFSMSNVEPSFCCQITINTFFSGNFLKAIAIF